MTEQEQLREELKSHVEYKRGEIVRARLKQIAEENYIPKHTDKEYVDFMGRHECSVTINHAQSSNHPYYYQLFSVVSQHVMGDCMREVLDNAMYCEVNGLPNRYWEHPDHKIAHDKAMKDFNRKVMFNILKP